ncbi:hypothetical protein MJA45_02585 [Paenibacillus aurantius]|uniref:ABC transporter permease n=1 Tax=Paenibacillus aurantius TaxID=2918900 RepID=A0AA96RFY2_9BACL|nr:hypothetical protein [Paenibacillus aurantius]WNQ11966.1 hypothetical protein MJA45_02585 [Paenibacillus aurantius]
MGRLIHSEWVKITKGKGLLALSVLYFLAYAYLTHTHYRWNPTSAWEAMAYFPYSAGAVTEGLLLLLALSSVYTEEDKGGTTALILSSRYGRARLPLAKLAAALLFTTVLVLGCWIVCIGTQVWHAGWDGWQEPLREWPRYSLSPYKLSAWEYVVVQIVTNWLGCAVFAIFLLSLSAWSRHSLTVFFIGGMMLVLPFFIRNHSSLDIYWLLQNLPMTEVMRVENLYSRPRYVEWKGGRMPLPLASFYLYMLLLAGLFGSAACRAYRGREIR